MVSRYSIVQYVPNPIADQRINIGVLAFDDNRVCVRFLSNWERVKRFGMEDIHNILPIKKLSELIKK